LPADAVKVQQWRSLPQFPPSHLNLLDSSPKPACWPRWEAAVSHPQSMLRKQQRLTSRIYRYKGMVDCTVKVRPSLPHPPGRRVDLPFPFPQMYQEGGIARFVVISLLLRRRKLMAYQQVLPRLRHVLLQVSARTHLPPPIGRAEHDYDRIAPHAALTVLLADKLMQLTRP